MMRIAGQKRSAKKEAERREALAARGIYDGMGEKGVRRGL